jgi:transcriptional regulator with XRE-family HTH domain
MDIPKFLHRTGLKQKELAKKLECSISLINKWAVKRAVPSYENIISLIKAGALLDEIFDMEIQGNILEKYIKTEPKSEKDKIKELEARLENVETILKADKKL